MEHATVLWHIPIEKKKRKQERWEAEKDTEYRRSIISNRGMYLHSRLTDACFFYLSTIALSFSFASRLYE